MISNVHRVDHSYAYRVGPLRRFPLVAVENTNTKLLLCPMPTLLFWRLTAGLYYDLIAQSDEFPNALGTSIERYIGDVLRVAVSSAHLRFVPQAPYGTKQRPKATSDWLIVEDDAAAAFIEVAESNERPLHLFLGSDSFSMAKAQMENIQKDLNMYERLSRSTDFKK